MRCRICAVTALPALAAALSSHSPQDLFAFPKYSVQLHDWDQAVLNETAEEILAKEWDRRTVEEAAGGPSDEVLEAGSLSGDQSERSSERRMLMRTTNDQAFLCTLPPLPSRTTRSPTATQDAVLAPLTDEQREELAKEKQRRLEEGLKRGLELLEPLKNTCFFTRVGWFTYSFCYGNGEIRQFHAVLIAGHNHPHEDPYQDVYTLGYHPSHPSSPHHQARLDGAPPSQNAITSAGELAELGRSPNHGFGLSEILKEDGFGASPLSYTVGEDEMEQKLYIVQRWEGGTVCDMTGRPRKAEVQFHCSTVSTDHIAIVREVSICEYLIVIHTPRLCSDPLFLDGGGSGGKNSRVTTEIVKCQPIVDGEALKRWVQARDREAERNRKDAERLERLRLEATEKPAAAGAPAPEETPASEALHTPEGKAAPPTPGGKIVRINLVDDEMITLFYDPDTGELNLGEVGGEGDPGGGQSQQGTGADAQETVASLEDLWRVLRESLTAALLGIRGEAPQQQQPNAQPQHPLAQLLSALQAASAQAGKGGPPRQEQQEQEEAPPPPQPPTGRAGPNRKRAQLFPAQAHGNAPHQPAQIPTAVLLQKVAQQGRLRAGGGGPLGGLPSGRSPEHEQQAERYGRKAESNEGEEKKRTREEL